HARGGSRQHGRGGAVTRTASAEDAPRMEAARDLVKHARSLVEHARAMDALWQETNPVYSMLAGPDGEWEDSLVEALGDVMVYAENRAAQHCRLAHAVDVLHDEALAELER